MSLQRFPGFIDAHVHLREPGATHKEDFYTGSRAAIAGGFTFVIDMPNNPIPTITKERLEEKINLAKKALCDVGFYFGTDGKNMNEFSKVWNLPQVFGLKVYCSHTTGDLLIEDEQTLKEIFSSWNSEKPILVHAEKDRLMMALKLAEKFSRRLHVCHISLKEEVEMVREVKQRGQKVTAGVTPHHLYFSRGPGIFLLKGYGEMKPPIGTKDDQKALWQALKDGTIDIVETDHAPHTKEEKEKDSPFFGVPGLETAVGLMFKAVKDGRITIADVLKYLNTNPRKIFNIPEQLDTFVELDSEKEYLVGKIGYETKCGWSPFEGMNFFGKPETVVFRGKKLLEGGKIIN